MSSVIHASTISLLDHGFMWDTDDDIQQTNANANVPKTPDDTFKQDCYGDWASWGDCKPLSGKNCGQGKRTRTFDIQVHSKNGGKACVHEEKDKKKPCELDPCIDCTFTSESGYDCEKYSGVMIGEGNVVDTKGSRYKDGDHDLKKFKEGCCEQHECNAFMFDDSANLCYLQDYCLKKATSGKFKRYTFVKDEKYSRNSEKFKKEEETKQAAKSAKEDKKI